MNTVVIVLLLQSVTHSCVERVSGHRVERIYKGSDDAEGKYPYVVALVDVYRHCTGTLITANWVLTAAHCLFSATQVQFGNMSIHPTEAITRTILSMVVPPSRRFSTNDIGLVRIRAVSMKQFAPLSALDYKAVLGHSVQYAGFGLTHTKGGVVRAAASDEDDVRPLQVGDGVITQCDFDGIVYTLGPFVCVSPKCSNSKQDTLPGDSGGPLFLDGKVLAVLHGGPIAPVPVSYYTPLSPYLQWIYDVITANRTNLSDFEQSILVLLQKQALQQKLQINPAINSWFKNSRLIKH